MIFLLKNKKFRYFLLIISFFNLSSCLSSVENTGFMFDLTDYEYLQEEVATKSEVLQIMGSASFVSHIDQEKWLYYSQNVKKFLFFKPKITDRKIVILTFDDNEILQKIENYSLKDEKNIKFSSNYTKVEGFEKGIFKSLFSNIGRVSTQ